MAHRPPLTVAALIAGALSLAGCTGSGSATPSGTGDTSGVPDSLLPYYTQVVTWSDCGDGDDCTTVTAPIDWGDPSGGDLHLAVVRHPATSGDPVGTLFMNPGGPGFSGVGVVRDQLGVLFGVPLIEGFDLVSWDPRGAGASTAVECPVDEATSSPSDPLPGTAEWLAEQRDEAQDYVDSCEAHSGAILPFVSTVQSAHDLDLLRALLGERTLDYLGFSYGTLLGATYAGLWPDRVDRMVLDGAVDPAEPLWEQKADQLGGFETALGDFLADCVTRSDCPFTGTVDEARTQLDGLLATVEATPIRAGDGRRMNGTGLLSAVSAALYAPEEWRTLRRALSEAAAGRAGVAFGIVDAYDDRGGTDWADAFQAYHCNDDGALSAAERALFEARAAEVAPTFAPYRPQGVDVCSLWPAASVPPTAPITADGAPPIVVVGTTGDPATPFAAAQALAGELSSGVLVTYDGEGHTAYPGSSACIDAAIEAYLLEGTMPEEGLVCE